MKMKQVIRFFALFMATICAPSFADTYTYTGAAYSTVVGGYTTSMSVTGSFETSAPIPPSSTNLNLLSLITSWSFSDGQQTLTDANSVIDLPGRPGVSPLGTTDAAGNLVSAQIFLVDDPIATAVGELNAVLLIDPTVSEAEIDTMCDGLGVGGSCDTYLDNASPPTQKGISSAPGTWVTTAAPPVTPPVTPAAVPTLSAYGLALTVLGLLVVATRRLRASAKRD